MYYLLLLQSVMVLGLILWVTKAPDFRFGVSYLIPGIALFVTCAMLLPFKSISVPRLVGLIGVPVLAIGVAIELGGRIDWSQVLSSDYSGYREIETEEYTYPSGLTIRIPRQDRGDQCWAASLLCNPGHWVYRTLPGPDTIELRGESLSDGFRNLDQRVEKGDLKKLWQF